MSERYRLAGQQGHLDNGLGPNNVLMESDTESEQGSEQQIHSDLYSMSSDGLSEYQNDFFNGPQTFYIGESQPETFYIGDNPQRFYIGDQVRGVRRTIDKNDKRRQWDDQLPHGLGKNSRRSGKKRETTLTEQIDNVIRPRSGKKEALEKSISNIMHRIRRLLDRIPEKTGGQRLKAAKKRSESRGTCQQLKHADKPLKPN
jgi:hypothetical protein